MANIRRICPLDWIDNIYKKESTIERISRTITVSYHRHHHHHLLLFIVHTWKKKGYSSNYRTALLYVVCHCYCSIFSTQKENQQRAEQKYSIYIDMKVGKRKRNEKKKEKISFEFSIKQN